MFTSANLSGVDLREATGFSGSSAITTNTILPDGTIQGLDLNTSNPMLIVRGSSNYEEGPASVHGQQGMVMATSSSLEMALFYISTVDYSTISFDPGIPVTLGGNLVLSTPRNFETTNLSGNSFQLFDWAGVSPSGQFASITSDLPSGYSWDTSQLYTTGDITLVPEPSTFALFSVGVLGLAAYAWRRRKQ